MLRKQLTQTLFALTVFSCKAADVKATEIPKATQEETFLNRNAVQAFAVGFIAGASTNYLEKRASESAYNTTFSLSYTTNNCMKNQSIIEVDLFKDIIIPFLIEMVANKCMPSENCPTPLVAELTQKIASSRPAQLLPENNPLLSVPFLDYKYKYSDAGHSVLKTLSPELAQTVKFADKSRTRNELFYSLGKLAASFYRTE